MSNGTTAAVLHLARVVCDLEAPPSNQSALDRMIALAQHYDVVSPLADRLLRHDVVEPIPDSLLQHLSRSPARSVEPVVFALLARRSSLRQVQSLMDALEEATAALGEAGIDVLAMKGAHVLRHGWLRSDERSMRDLDLLVRVDDARDALSVLASLGFEAIDPRLPDGRRLIAVHHLTPLVRSGSSGSIELHLDVLPARWRRTLPTPAVWGRAVNTSDGLSMAEADAVTHLLLHALGSDAAHRARTVPMRALVDVAGRLRRTDLPPVDWEEIRDRFVQGGDGAMFDGFTAVASHVGLAGLPVTEGARRHAAATFALAGRPRLATSLNTNARRLELLRAERSLAAGTRVAGWLFRRVCSSAILGAPRVRLRRPLERVRSAGRGVPSSGR